MAGETITADWQAEYQGLLLGEGSYYSIVQIDGLVSHPEVVQGDQGRLRRHGLRPGDDFLGGRTVVLTVEVQANTDVEFRSAVNALKTAFRPGEPEAPLVVRLPGVGDGSLMRVGVRPRRVAWPVGRDFYYRMSVVPIELFATDPRLYSNTLAVASATLPTTSGGLTFDALAPITFGATSTGGTLSLTNSGTFSTPVTFRIDGPVQTPRIIHEESGLELKVLTDVLAGEYLLIDTESRSVLLNGTADRYYLLSTASRWFELEPGENTIDFRGATTAAGTLSATFRSAWI